MNEDQSIRSKSELNINKSNNDNYDDNTEVITYRNFREKNMKIIGYDFPGKRNKGLFNSRAINDIYMKKNIYLPRLIDRMKYNIPRNLRNNNGFIILGNNSNNMIGKYKEINFIRCKNAMPTDMYFYFEKDKNQNTVLKHQTKEINPSKINYIKNKYK